jgi:predicted GNAT superfamily acetyltransferase
MWGDEPIGAGAFTRYGSQQWDESADQLIVGQQTAIAQQQGQKIYTITPQNASTALAKLPVSSSVGQEIRNAVQAGKEVTVHEKPVSAFGGYGYSIVDPETGAAGAYVIEGGGSCIL